MADDRSQLERERLERQKRRKLANGQFLASGSANGRDQRSLQSDLEERLLKRRSFSRSSSISSSTSISDEKDERRESQERSKFYWDHEIGSTAAIQRVSPERRAFDISTLISSLSGMNDDEPSGVPLNTDLKLAIISAPTVDTAWLMQYIHPEKVPAIIVTSPSHDPQDDIPYGMESEPEPSLRFLGRTWVYCKPAFEGTGVMNASYMLLLYGTGRLRVVITSASFTMMDWEAVENFVWVQDFPLCGVNTTSGSIPPLAQRFASVLTDILSWQKVSAALQSLHAVNLAPGFTSLSVQSLLAKYDLSAIKVAAVCSIPGKHEGWSSVQKVGHTGLMSAVNGVGAKFPSGHTRNMIYLTSALIPCTSAWIRQFEISADGGDRHQSFLKMSTKAKQALPFPDHNRFSLIYPTKRTVETNFGNEKTATGLRCSPKLWDLPSFPKHLLRDAKSKFGVINMRSKMIVATLCNVQTLAAAPGDASDVAGWCYMGSHDFTPAAWGEWLPTSTWFTPLLKIANCELGIILPILSSTDVDELACFRRPPPPYEVTDEPWSL